MPRPQPSLNIASRMLLPEQLIGVGGPRQPLPREMQRAEPARQMERERVAERTVYAEDSTAFIALSATQYDFLGLKDDCLAAGKLYRMMSTAEQERLTSGIARALHGLAAEVIHRQLVRFARADAEYGRLVSRKLRRL